MSRNAAFQRKVIYLAVLTLLIYPIYWLSAPSVRGTDGAPDQPGGQLAQLRDEKKLSQANLGEIDPASESMKLASLGLNGVAVNLLWQKAIYYKKVEDFENLYATLNQIRHLQANFISVFEFQGHNISYNVSVELDDYRRRYEWVIRGIEFLIEGIDYNEHEPRLQWNVGWFTGQKIGRADEHILFRELFRDHKDFHEDLDKYIEMVETRSRADNKPDNWLVGKQWYLISQDLVDNKGAKLRGKSPLVFNSFPPMSSINYSMARQEEGSLDPSILIDWAEASEEWKEFGQRPIPTSFGHNLLLGEEERSMAEFIELVKELEKLASGVKEKLEKERQDSLTPEERTALDTPNADRTDEQYGLAAEAERKLRIAPDDIVEASPADIREKARKLAVKANDRKLMADRIRRYRTVVNYQYWKTRCEIEQEENTLAARVLVRDATAAYRDSDIVTAQEKFEEAWDHWAILFKEHPELIDDVTGQDLMDHIRRYVDLMNRQFGQSVPDTFPLRELVDRHDSDLLPPVSSNPNTEPPTDPSEEPADDPAPTEEPTTEEPTTEEPTTPEPPASEDDPQPADDNPEPTESEPEPADTPDTPDDAPSDDAPTDDATPPEPPSVD